MHGPINIRYTFLNFQM